MIKAGKLDRVITVTRESETVSASGSVLKNWAPIATVRAELVQLHTMEAMTGFGESDFGDAVFRIRYLSGLETSNRVRFEGEVFDIDGITEIGRRHGLELSCSKVAE